VSEPPDEPAAAPPLLRIVRGEPSAEELVALVAVVAAGAATVIAAEPSFSGWRDRTDLLRRPLAVGRGGWQLVGREPGTRTRAGW